MAAKLPVILDNRNNNTVLNALQKLLPGLSENIELNLFATDQSHITGLGKWFKDIWGLSFIYPMTEKLHAQVTFDKKTRAT